MSQPSIGIRVRLLGPVDAVGDAGSALPIGGSRRASLLAFLSLRQPGAASRSEIIDALWGEEPPVTAANTVQSHVSGLRKVLGHDAIVTVGGSGYRLGEDVAVDVSDFEAMAGRAVALLEDDPAAAAELLRGALALWRGPALADLGDAAFVQREATRLEELRAGALEHRIEADLRSGRAVELVGELESLVAQHPWRESLRALQMRTLYHSGRQADALDAYDAARAELLENLGLDPSPALRDVYQRILNQTDELPSTGPSTVGVQPEELPSGTVTLLLTDIVGSASLWDTRPGDMAMALETVEGLIDQHVAAGGGRLLKSRGEGDSTLSVFSSAPNAVMAAIEAIRAIEAADLPNGIELPVRSAIHTGEAHQRSGDYFGGTLNRATRVRGLAHGGQILLSDATAQLIHGLLDDHLSVEALGVHPLSGLDRPERIHHLVDAERERAFPPIRVIPDNFPAQTSALIGRDRDLREANERLSRSDVRLVTILGPGGVGKTRMAIQVAADQLANMEHGAWFVELAPIEEAANVGRAISGAIGAPDVPGESLSDTLRRLVGGRRALLLLDNFEHVMDAAGLVADLVARVPTLSIIVTSREPLRIRGEHELHLAPLELPDPEATSPSQIAATAAVRLFVERTRTSDPGFEIDSSNAASIAEICATLDGLPLAIELAAARTKMLTPAQLSDGLSDRFALLGRGSRDLPGRHQTLRRAIDWSHDLLSDSDRQLFRVLAVFSGGASITEIQLVSLVDDDVLLLDGLTSLTEKNLVRAGGEQRFTMLQTIREYAVEQLRASGEREVISNRHASCFETLACRMSASLVGAERDPAVRTLRLEIDNIRSAISSSLEFDAERALRLITGMALWWITEGEAAEGLEWLRSVPIEARDASPPELRLGAQVLEGALAVTLSEDETGLDMLEEILPELRVQGDATWLARALIHLAMSAAFAGRFEEAKAHLSEALGVAQRHGSGDMVATIEYDLGVVAEDEGVDYKVAVGHYERSVAAARQCGDALGVAFGLGGLGAAIREVDPAKSRELLQESLHDSLELDHQPCEAIARIELALLDLREARFGEVVRNCNRAMSISHTVGDRGVTVEAIEVLASCENSSGDPRVAVQLLSLAQRMRTEFGQARTERTAALYAAALTTARAETAADFDALWGADGRISIDEAIERILDSPRSDV